MAENRSVSRGNSGRGNAYLAKACHPRTTTAPAPKPRSTLKSTKGLERRTELAKVSAKRAEKRPAARSTFDAAPPPRREGRDAAAAGAWRDRVIAAAEGRDVVTGEPFYRVGPGGEVIPLEVHAHHWLEASSIYAMRRRLGLTGADLIAAMYDDRNGGALLAYTHRQHTGWTERIERHHVPDVTWDFAAELDALAGVGWATATLERDYPQESTR